MRRQQRMGLAAAWVWVVGGLTLGFFGLTPARADTVLTTISGPIVNPTNNHTYFLLEPATWAASEAKAVAMGGHLATVRNSDENNWIYNEFSTFGGVGLGLWIGLNSVSSSDKYNYVWSSGETSAYRNWGGREPSHGDPYVHIFWPGDGRQPGWNDNADLSYYGPIPMGGVVELTATTVPLPAAAWSGLALLAGLGMWRIFSARPFNA